MLISPKGLQRKYQARQNRIKKQKEKEEELKTRDHRNIYWGPDGNLWTGSISVYFFCAICNLLPVVCLGRSVINRDEHLLEILEQDTCDEADIRQLWMIMPSRWLRRWLLFIKFRIAEEPGRITMMSLLVEDSSAENGYRPKRTLKPPNYTKLEDPNGEEHPGHYR